MGDRMLVLFVDCSDFELLLLLLIGVLFSNHSSVDTPFRDWRLARSRIVLSAIGVVRSAILFTKRHESPTWWRALRFGLFAIQSETVVSYFVRAPCVWKWGTYSEREQTGGRTRAHRTAARVQHAKSFIDDFCFCFVYCCGRQSAEKPLRIVTSPSVQRYFRSRNASPFFCLPTVKIISVYHR